MPDQPDQLTPNKYTTSTDAVNYVRKDTPITLRLTYSRKCGILEG